MCHAISFERLDVDSPTVPLAELLVTKLQIVRMNEKDVKDIVAIVLEHPVGKGDDETINASRDRRALRLGLGPLAHDARLDRARRVPASTRLELSPDERDCAAAAGRAVGARRARAEVDASSRTRARVGDRTRWYEEPDEVEHRELDGDAIGARRFPASGRPTELERCASATARGGRRRRRRTPAWTASLLVASDLADHPSHGLMRLPGYLARSSGARPTREPCRASSATRARPRSVDGELGLGQVVARAATDEAMARARLHGISCVAVRRCCHVGRLAHFAERIADEGQIGIVVANDAGAGQVVAPPGSSAARLSTNPLAIAAPRSGRAAVRARHVDERRVVRQGAGPPRARRTGARRLGARRCAAGARRLQGVRAGARRRDPGRRAHGGGPLERPRPRSTASSSRA